MTISSESMMIPGWLTSVMDQSGLERIRATVTTAEKRTSGEIVPMIVHSSIATGHVPLVAFLLFLAIFWGLLPFLVSMGALPVDYWGWAEVGVIAIAAALAWPLSKLDWFKRALTTGEDQAIAVGRRAQLEFYQSEIKATENKTGVLIFVSLLEHRAVVLADKAIAQKLPAETWNKIVELIIDETKKNDFTTGMCRAIEEVGEILAREFPIQVGDRNELADRLVIKE